MPTPPVKLTMNCFGHFGTRLWIPAILIMSLSQTACTTVDKFVCYGTGTCDRDPRYANVAAGGYVSPVPQSVITPLGNLIIVRDQQNGTISSVISVSGGK